MRFHRQGVRNGGQEGFSLVELLIAMAIGGILTAGLAAGIVQVMASNAGSIAHMTAVKEVENAVHWLSRDAEMAQFFNGNNISSSNLTPVLFSSQNLTMNWNQRLRNEQLRDSHVQCEQWDAAAGVHAGRIDICHRSSPASQRVQLGLFR